ncbi:MAG: hypothetical protein KJ709_01790 [Nanoarchaeota archaeon]|nr:hypothetical protein [Nanoarchaeota archaeon]
MKGLALAMFLLLLPAVCAQNYIYGWVFDAPDGEDANGYEIIAYHPEVGMDDYVSDIIGPGGLSSAHNQYIIDCEALLNPCSIGDTLNVEVYPQNGHKAGPVQVTVSGWGIDFPANMTLQRVRPRPKMAYFPIEV